LLAIDGTELKAPDDPDRLLAATKGMLTLSLAASPDGPRNDVQIKPLRNELALRQADWVANNRQTVDRMSGGRLGYLYLPDMLASGVIAMTQPYANKDGLVVDVRYNRGGFITPWVLQKLQETPLGYFVNRQGGTEPRPATAMTGLKIVLANQYSASDAEQFAYFFKQQGGKVLGVRTQGGVRGIASEWQLMDGGGITVPFNQIYSADGKWPVEGHGVDPDVRVDEEPAALLAGQDPQLEATTRMLMSQIGRHLNGMPKPPPAPNTQNDDRATQ
jgi:tricorn protease